MTVPEPTMSRLLARLPPELWQHIVSFTDQPTAKEASRASKDFRQIFIRRVFQRCRIRPITRRLANAMSAEESKSGIPSARDHVRHLHATTAEWGWDGIGYHLVFCIRDMPFLTCLDLQFLVSCDGMPELGRQLASIPGPWSIRFLRTNAEGELLQAILEKCPQLLKFEHSPEWNYTSKYKPMRYLLESQVELQHLGLAFADIDERQRQDKYSVFDTLGKFKNLKSLVLQEGAWLPYKLRGDQQSLHDFVMKCADDLVQLLNLNTSLKDVTITLSKEKMFTDGFPTLAKRNEGKLCVLDAGTFVQFGLCAPHKNIRRCRLPCRHCEKDTSATFHTDCFNLFALASKQSAKLFGLWTAACWRYPWQGYEAPRLAPIFDANFGMAAAVQRNAAPDLAFSTEITRMIWDGVPQRQVWQRYTSTLQLAEFLGNNEHYGLESLPLHQIAAWQRGQHPSKVDATMGAQPNIILTVDSLGLLKIERSASAEYGWASESNYAFSVIPADNSSHMCVKFMVYYLSSL
ncbi:hypothetical protein HJFPF1_05100 [Paramyrothecium foliicola]|nr:hypothetical protein HJFPF1_05100 [Paramyrothecium foliicola]